MNSIGPDVFDFTRRAQSARPAPDDRDARSQARRAAFDRARTIGAELARRVGAASGLPLRAEVFAGNDVGGDVQVALVQDGAPGTRPVVRWSRGEADAQAALNEARAGRAMRIGALEVERPVRDTRPAWVKGWKVGDPIPQEAA